MMWKIIGGIVCLILILGTGFWLSGAGKPLNSGLLTLHKLISIAAVVILGIAIYRVNKSSGLSSSTVASIIVTGVLFLGTIAFGGILSLGREMPLIVFRMHQTLPYLTAISTGVTLFLL